jgi:putative ABC transport system permease protein
VSGRIALTINASVSHLTPAAFSDLSTPLLSGGLGVFAAGYALRGYLYGVGPLDPMALGPVLVLLGLAALAATLVPLRRAVRTDPAVALRTE